MKQVKVRTKFFIISVICFTTSTLCGQGDEYISIYAKASPILPPLQYYLASGNTDTWVAQKHKYNNHEMADVPLWTIKVEYEQGDGNFNNHPLLINRNIPEGNHIEYTPCKRTTTGCSVSNKFGDHDKDWDFLVNKLDEILKDAPCSATTFRK